MLKTDLNLRNIHSDILNAPKSIKIAIKPI